MQVFQVIQIIGLNELSKPIRVNQGIQVKQVGHSGQNGTERYIVTDF